MAYILAGQLGVNELRIFKVFPLGLLIILVFPSSKNMNAVKIIAALVFGAIGD